MKRFKMKPTALAYCAIVTLLIPGPGLPAQNLQVSDTCLNWQTISAKNTAEPITFKLSVTEQGQEFLHWSKPNGKAIKLDIFSARDTINPKGKIEICSTGHSLFVFKDSMNLLELKNSLKLKPGFYAMKATIGYHADPFINKEYGDSSDWIAIRVK